MMFLYIVVHTLRLLCTAFNKNTKNVIFVPVNFKKIKYVNRPYIHFNFRNITFNILIRKVNIVFIFEVSNKLFLKRFIYCFSRVAHKN